jgi:hypothetical protein
MLFQELRADIEYQAAGKRKCEPLEPERVVVVIEQTAKAPSTSSCMPNGTAAVLGRAGEDEERLGRLWTVLDGSAILVQATLSSSLRRSKLGCLRDVRSLERGRPERDGKIRK